MTLTMTNMWAYFIRCRSSIKFWQCLRDCYVIICCIVKWTTEKSENKVDMQIHSYMIHSCCTDLWTVKWRKRRLQIVLSFTGRSVVVIARYSCRFGSTYAEWGLGRQRHLKVAFRRMESEVMTGCSVVRGEANCLTPGHLTKLSTDRATTLHPIRHNVLLKSFSFFAYKNSLIEFRTDPTVRLAYLKFTNWWPIEADLWLCFEQDFGNGINVIVILVVFADLRCWRGPLRLYDICPLVDVFSPLLNSALWVVDQLGFTPRKVSVR